VIISRDITEKEQAGRRLRRSEARKGALLSSAPDAILSLDDDGIVTEANPAAEALFECSAEALIGSYFDRIISSFDTETSLAPYMALQERLIWGRGVALAIPCTGVRATGESFPAELSVSEVQGSGQDGFVIFVRDVSERARVEAHLRESQKLEAIGRLAGGVAHDFNNLLTVIQGYAEFAASASEPEGQLRDDLNEILRASGRARDLTRQLLAFARRQVTEPRVVSPNELVGGMEKMLARLVSEDVQIQSDLEGESWSVYIDPGQFEQVIVNLVVNARDAMPNGGRVTISTENLGAEHAALLPSGLAAGNYVVVSVADTGSGIPKETLAHVFEPFFTTKGPDKGVGLGLATCYGIAKQASGEITVESEPGQGTVFRLWLPQATALSSVTSRPVEAKTAGGTETILLVEDERAVRSMTERFLRSLGYTVVVASDGAHAIRLLQTTHDPIHLLISDVVMPRMNGLELAERVVARSPATNVLFVSGYPSDVLAQRGFLDREISLLAKPFTFDALARRIREALTGETNGLPADAEEPDADGPLARALERRLRDRYSA
jgi:PAS domain S-box-containing protein